MKTSEAAKTQEKHLPQTVNNCPRPNIVSDLALLRTFVVANVGRGET